LRGLLFVAVAVGVAAGLYLGRSVLIPITLAANANAPTERSASPPAVAFSPKVVFTGC
jgi:hypothetical protein